MADQVDQIMSIKDSVARKLKNKHLERYLNHAQDRAVARYNDGFTACSAVFHGVEYAEELAKQWGNTNE